MESFLGVPVRVGEHIYGNLYLTESENGSFTEDDQELIVALAATAGIAIENARLYDVARTREVWNAAIADVMAAMLDVSGENILDVIAGRVAALIDADLVAVAVPRGDGDVVLTTVHGSGAEVLRDRIYPAAVALSARALATRRAVSVDGQSPSTGLDWHPDVGPTMAIPLFAGDDPLGVLSISRPTGGAAFTDADVEMAFAFAAQASIALEVVRAREDRQRLETAQDRARIARDLHDHVIQRLFGAGLSLQAVSATVDAETSAHIEAQIDAIDAAIQDIRTVIFALSSGERRGAKRLRDRLLDVVAEVAGNWPSQPRISFAGPLDSLVSAELADDLVAVLRELLTNVVKHAHSKAVEIEVAIVDDKVKLAVDDDGRGISGSAPRSGLANVAERAALRHGDCRIAPRPGGGTRIEWSVPVGTRARRKRMIRVFLVDDHEIVRRGIAQLVDAEPDLEVVGEAGTVREAARRIAATRPTVAVLDVRLPDGNGIDLCRDIRSANPDVHCLILTAYDDDEALRSAVLAGASGYVLKDVRSRSLVEAVRMAASGATIQAPDVMLHAAMALHPESAAAHESPGPVLSLRENQVLSLIADGLTNREIGERLGLAEKTVKNYVSALLAKLGMERRTQAAVYGADRKHRAD